MHQLRDPLLPSPRKTARRLRRLGETLRLLSGRGRDRNVPDASSKSTTRAKAPSAFERRSRCRWGWSGSSSGRGWRRSRAEPGRHGHRHPDRGRGPDRADARQPARPTKRARDDRGPARRSGGPDEGARRAGPHARDLCASRDRRAGARARQARDGRRHVGAGAAGRVGPPVGQRERLEPLSLHPDPRAGRQRAPPGRVPAGLRHGRPVGERARRPRSGGRAGHRADPRPGRASPRGRRGVGGRMRRRAQFRARALRHRVPRRSLRARLLRGRHADDGTDGPGPRQRLSLARRVPSLLPDARRRSLAGRRNPPAGAPRPGRSDSRRRDPRDPPGSGGGARLSGVHLVLDLPHPSPPRGTLPRRALFPVGRRRAHPQPGRRAGHEHGASGRVQPRLEARRSSRRATRTRPSSTPTERSAFRSRGACSRRRTGCFRSSSRRGP